MIIGIDLDDFGVDVYDNDLIKFIVGYVVDFEL